MEHGRLSRVLASEDMPTFAYYAISATGGDQINTATLSLLGHGEDRSRSAVGLLGEQPVREARPGGPGHLGPRRRRAMTLSLRPQRVLQVLLDRAGADGVVVPSSRGELFASAGLDRSAWRRALQELVDAGLVRVLETTRPRDPAGYEILPAGRSWAGDPRTTHQRPTSDPPVQLKPENPNAEEHRGEEQQQAARPASDPRTTREPVGRLEELLAELEQLRAEATAREVVRLLKHGDLATPGARWIDRDVKPGNVTPPADLPARKAEEGSGEAKEALHHAIGRAGHADLDDVVSALAAEGVEGEDVVAFARTALDKPDDEVKARYSDGKPNRGALARGIARQGLSPREREAALAAHAPPALVLPEPTGADVARLAALRTKLENAQRKNDPEAVRQAEEALARARAG